MLVWKYKMQWVDKYTPLLFDKIDSTNEEALRLIRSKAQGNFLIWSKAQTKGKGRPGKEWISKEGNLFLTLLQQKSISQIEASHASFVISIALGKTLEKFANEKSKITYKWPNDILFNNRKIGNFILEVSSSTTSDVSNYLIIGIAINLNSYPDNLAFQATSLESEIRKEVNASELVTSLVENIDLLQKSYQENGFDYIRSLWIQNAAYINEIVKINSGYGYEEGKLLGIDEEGNMLLEQKNGEINKYISGEMINYRPVINEI